MSSLNKTKIIVVDFTGNIKLQTMASNVSSYDINITFLKAGNYLVKIETGDNVITKQFIKE